MKKVDVHYNGWGENWHLGTLAEDGRRVPRILFEYSPEALRQGIEHSPRHLPLSTQTYGPFPDHLMHLPGFIADALPDGWGMLLMNRMFRKNGWMEHDVTPLTRLSFIGHRSIGALTFSPQIQGDLESQWLDLQQLARASQLVLDSEDPRALRELVLLGGSPQGARPKVLVHFDVRTHRASSSPVPSSTPWLVKFQSQGEDKSVCATEELYARIARACLIEMPQTAYIDLGPSLAAFGIERFDVEAGMRVPQLSLAGLLHANFRMPQVDYTTFLRATAFLTRDVRETWKAYERAVFNVLFHNRDDHSKNFSYRLSQAREWKLSPGYDLTYSQGPGGEHTMDVCGEGRSVTREKLLELAKQASLDSGRAATVIDRMLAVVAQVPELVQELPLSTADLHSLLTVIRVNAARLKA